MQPYTPDPSEYMRHMAALRGGNGTGMTNYVNYTTPVNRFYDNQLRPLSNGITVVPTLSSSPALQSTSFIGQVPPSMLSVNQDIQRAPDVVATPVPSAAGQEQFVSTVNANASASAAMNTAAINDGLREVDQLGHRITEILQRIGTDLTVTISKTGTFVAGSGPAPYTSPSAATSSFYDLIYYILTGLFILYIIDLIHRPRG